MPPDPFYLVQGMPAPGAEPYVPVSIRRLIVLLTILAAPFIMFKTFTDFRVFDDEGTILIVFRSFIEFGRIYDDIYSLYGPFYNEIYGFLFKYMNVPVSHSVSRLLSAMMWFAYSAGFALFCFQVTRSAALMTLCYGLVVAWLAPLASSPGHPEELCLLLLAGILLLGCHIGAAAPTSARPGATAPTRVKLGATAPTLAGLGVLVAALLLVKINIGVYVGGALALTLLHLTTPTLPIKVAKALVVIGLLLLPIGVQSLLFHFSWVVAYCLFATLSIGSAVFIVISAPGGAVLTPSAIMAVAGSALLAAGLIIGTMMLGGSSAWGILNAVVLQNARFVQNWYILYHTAPFGVASAIASLLAALAYRWSATRPHLQHSRDVALLVIKAGLLILGAATFGSPGRLLQLLGPFCWVAVTAPPHTPRPQVVGRTLAGLIGSVMTLYPFPVAGHQLSIAGLIPIILLPIMAQDLVLGLRQVGGITIPRHWLSRAAVMVALVLGGFHTVVATSRYWDRAPLGLPGTAFIRVPAEQGEDLRWVADQLASCGSSYSFPGLLSFVFWTGHKPPTNVNVNAVLNFIDHAGQTQIVDALARQPRLCIVYQPELLRFLNRGQLATDPPLFHYIGTEFVSAAERHGYHILRRVSEPR